MNNVYGTKKPALINPLADADIFYHYRLNRNTDSNNFGAFKRVDESILKNAFLENEDGTQTTLPGMYNLRLPLSIFNERGIYTILIKPKEVKTRIIDVSTLSAYPNIKGIVIDITNMNAVNGSLVGSRIEYFDSNGNRSDEFRIITSNNKCEPVAQNMNNSSQKGVRYRFNDSSNLMFCTLTPSTGMSFKASSLPFIGTPSQEISIINTKFNPITIELEIVDHDIETLSTMLEGEQLINLDRGMITTFNTDGSIYKQVSTGDAVDPETGLSHHFRINNTNIDFSEDIKDIKNNI